MKTNITIDNYEAYLLDYTEGNLSPDEAEQLKAFVATQGLDWDELTEELPYLEAPQVAYENKADLKQRPLSLRSLSTVEASKGRPQRNIIPLYVKIASVAAAVGLLLIVGLWPEKSMPKVEPVANLKPIEISRIDTEEPLALLPRRVTESIDPLPRTSLRWDDMLSEATNQPDVVFEKEAMPLLTELPAKNITSLQSTLPLADFDEPDFDLLAYQMNTGLAYNQYESNAFSDEDESELSLIGKAIFKLTDGHHDSFASIISSSLNTAKKEISLAATDMALTAYLRADEHFEKAKERWENNLEE